MTSPAKEACPAAAQEPAPHPQVEHLYRQHFQELLRFQRHRVSCRDLAADLIQELFLRLLSRGENLPLLRHPRGFLFKSAHHLAAEAYRSPRWHRSGDGEDISEQACHPDPLPDARAAHRQTLEQLAVTLDRHSRRCREVFFLHRFEGFSYNEIADRLGLSVSAVEKDMMRALQICHAWMHEHAD